MAKFREDFANIDLDTGTIHRTFMSHTLGEGDVYGDTFGVRVFRSGEPVSLSGLSVLGYMIRADGTTAIVNGSVSGNTAYVNLPEGCYAVPGAFQLAIKIIGDGKTVTARIVDGTVSNVLTGLIVDPGDIVPDIDSFTALVVRAENAADRIESIVITNSQISGTRYRIVATIPS